jgi:hypothetical protein
MNEKVVKNVLFYVSFARITAYCEMMDRPVTGQTIHYVAQIALHGLLRVLSSA